MTARLIKKGQRPQPQPAKPVKRLSEREVRERWLLELHLKRQAELQQAQRALLTGWPLGWQTLPLTRRYIWRALCE